MTGGESSGNSALVFFKAAKLDRVLRHVFLTLAALALVLKIAVPPGMMVADDRRNDLPFELVMCTIDGAMSVPHGAPLPGHEQDELAKDGKHAPCVFASHGAGAEPPSLYLVERLVFVEAPQAAPTPAVAPRPGQGLTAPPLPARGPPSQLI